MTDKNVTIGLVQTRVSEDIKNNMQNTVDKIREASSKGAKSFVYRNYIEPSIFQPMKEQMLQK